MKTKLNQLVKKQYDYIIVFSIVIALACFEIFSVSYPNGWDGFFYEMQIFSWQEFGKLHSENNALIYFILKAFSLIFSPAYSYKILAVLCSSVFCFLVYIYIKKNTSQIIALLGLALCLFSPFFIFNSHQFTKNILGLNFFLLYLISNKSNGKTIIFLALSFWAHKVAFAILVLYIIVDLIRKKNSKLLWYLIIFCIIILGLSYIPGLPQVADLKRFSGEFSSSPVWQPINFFKLYSFKGLNLSWWIYIIIFHLTLIVVLVKTVKTKKTNTLLLLILALLIPIFNEESGGMGYRLFLNTSILFVLLLPNIIQSKLVLYTLALLVIINIPFSFYSYKNEKFDPPINTYKSIVSKIPKQLSGNVLIVAHKGIKEQIIMNTEYDALNWIPNNIDSINIYRVVTDINDEDINLFSEGSEWKKLYTGYYFTKENVWSEFLLSLDKYKRNEQLTKLKTWKNPYLKRPSFLR